MLKEQNTEYKIVEAAKTVFVRKGMDGARMQEIADEAGINKALLHYYFRSKDRLFEKVFDMLFKDIFVIFEEAITNEMSFELFLEKFIRQYLQMLKEKPYLPQFIIHELNRNPERIVVQMQNMDFDKQELFKLINKAIDDKVIRPIHPVHLLTNIVSLCIFPFIAKPIITGFMLDGDKEKYQQYIDERPEEVIGFVKKALIL